MTVGEHRKALEGVPDDTEVVSESGDHIFWERFVNPREIEVYRSSDSAHGGWIREQDGPWESFDIPDMVFVV